MSIGRGPAALVLACLVGIAPVRAAPTGAAPACRVDARPMARVELLFGAARNDGAPIANAAWQAFLADEVTPRFPAGLTVFEAYGQWRGADGVVERSPARVLLIWYEPSAHADADIEAIRAAYRIRFAQASVMRIDGIDCVSF